MFNREKINKEAKLRAKLNLLIANAEAKGDTKKVANYQLQLKALDEQEAAESSCCQPKVKESCCNK